MKNKRKERKVETEFLSSMVFLIFSLFTSFTVFLVYKPTRSFNVEVKETVAENKPVKTKSVQAIAEHAPEKPKVPEKNNAIPVQTASVARTNTSESNDLVKRAIELVNQSQVGEARQLLEKVLQENPDHEEALVQLGLIHLLDLKDEKVAQTYFEKILTINPDNKVALTELVDIYADRADGAGVKYLESLYEKNPNTSIAMGIGQVLIENNPVAAIPYLEKGGEPALNDLGEAYVMSGNHAKALETFQVQEEKARARLQNADGEGNEYAKDELVRIMLNKYHALNALGNKEAAQQQMNEIRGQIGSDADFLTNLAHPSAKHPKNPVFKE